MRSRAVSTTAFLVLGAAVIATGRTAHAQTNDPRPLYALLQASFARPNLDVPKGNTTFTPVESSNLFETQLLSQFSDPARKKAMQTYMAQMNKLGENAYTAYGYETNDLGVALGEFLEAAWKISNGSYKNAAATAQDKLKTRAVVRQMQNALLAAPADKPLPTKSKQLLYEACTFMMGHLATQWQRAGTDAVKKTAVRNAAQEQLQTLLGIKAASLTRKPDGSFVSTSAVK